MPPVQFDVQFSFDVGSLSDWVQAIAALISLAFALALLVVTDRQRRIGEQANSIAERQTGLLDKQAAIAERQAEMVLRQGEIALELDRGRLMRVSAEATENGTLNLVYKNIGRSPVDIVGWVFWDLGEYANTAVEPYRHWTLRGQEMIEPGGSVSCITRGYDGSTFHRIPGSGGVFRIGVLVYYRTFGILREYRQGWVFSPRNEVSVIYDGTKHQGAGFEMDRLADEKDFDRYERIMQFLTEEMITTTSSPRHPPDPTPP